MSTSRQVGTGSRATDSEMPHDQLWGDGADRTVTFYGQLRIAQSDGITPSRMPTLLALCRQEGPEVEMRLFELTVSQQIQGCMTICMA